MQVTTDDDSPGRFTRIAVVEPPYWRAVIDAGEHDQRAERRRTVGDRQEHGDGGDRPDARQYADQRAEHHADETEAEIDRRHRRAEPGREIGEHVHLSAPRPGSAGRGNRRTGRRTPPLMASASTTSSNQRTSARREYPRSPRRLPRLPRAPAARSGGRTRRWPKGSEAAARAPSARSARPQSTSERTSRNPPSPTSARLIIRGK